MMFQSVSQLDVSQLISQLDDWSVGGLVSQLISQVVRTCCSSSGHICQLGIQSVDQLVGSQPTHQSASQSVNQLISQLVSQLASYLVSQLVTWLSSQLACQWDWLVSQLVNQFVGELIACMLVGQFARFANQRIHMLVTCNASQVAGKWCQGKRLYYSTLESLVYRSGSHSVWCLPICVHNRLNQCVEVHISRPRALNCRI